MTDKIPALCKHAFRGSTVCLNCGGNVFDMLKITQNVARYAVAAALNGRKLIEYPDLTSATTKWVTYRPGDTVDCD